jgi:hypothetical protein
MSSDLGYLPRIISIKVIRDIKTWIPTGWAMVGVGIPQARGSHKMMKMNVNDVLDPETVVHRTNTTTYDEALDVDYCGPYTHNIHGTEPIWLAMHPYTRGQWPSSIPPYDPTVAGEMRPPRRTKILKWDTGLKPLINDEWLEQDFIAHPYDPRYRKPRGKRLANRRATGRSIYDGVQLRYYE